MFKLKMKIKKAPLWLQLVRVLLVTLIVIGIALLATQSLWVPQLVSSIIHHEAADMSTWKTYSDTAQGFSIKYPPTFVVEESHNKSGTSHTYQITDLLASASDKSMDAGVSISILPRNVYVQRDNSRYGTLLEYIHNAYDGNPPPGENTLRLISVAALRRQAAGETEAYTLDTEIVESGKHMEAWVLQKGSMVYEIRAYPAEYPEMKEILSTFSLSNS